jgi:hypothetical protein
MKSPVATSRHVLYRIVAILAVTQAHAHGDFRMKAVWRAPVAGKVARVSAPSRSVLSRSVLSAVTVAVGLEALVLLGLGGYLVVNGIAGAPTSVVNAEIAGALTVVAGAGLAWVAVGLRARRRWSRAPAVLTQLLCLTVTWPLLQGGKLALGVPIFGLALASLVALLAPVTTTGLED